MKYNGNCAEARDLESFDYKPSDRVEWHDNYSPQRGTRTGKVETLEIQQWTGNPMQYSVTLIVVCDATKERCCLNPSDVRAAVTA